MKKVLLLLVLLLIITTLIAGCTNCRCATNITREVIESFSILDANLINTSCGDSCRQMLSITKKNDDGIVTEGIYPFPQKVYIHTDINDFSEAWGYDYFGKIIIHVPEEWAKTKGLI